MAGWRLPDFDYPLERNRIAQEPISERDRSRLMLLDRGTGRLQHRHFRDITKFLQPGDLLVLNDTRVVRARLRARKETGGGIEIFLLNDRGQNRWEVLVRGKVSAGTRVILESGEPGLVEERLPGGKRVVRFQLEKDLHAYMERYGRVPLPPYIHRNGDQRLSRLDLERYQTVYAAHPGAVAAPTAGLHFTPQLLDRIRALGVQIVFLTLHVGYGTFKPVTAVRIHEHRMDEEYYQIGEDTAEAVNQAVGEGRRVIAVGTTSCRALESAAGPEGRLTRLSGQTDLFIYPGYRFRVINGLITNFHLPRSTLLMLVSAFSGKELLDEAYREARERDYRFYSYGDAMCIL